MEAALEVRMREGEKMMGVGWKKVEMCEVLKMVAVVW
jgi:hypothetical protein